MCGITGFFSPNLNHINAQSISKKMVDTLEHRGPDNSAFWSDEINHLYFGHTRLSILDTSSAGHQPMINSKGDLIITFNGEIYNHLEVRKELQKLDPLFKFTSSCDTETLLEAITKFGLKKALMMFDGMFAFALYDLKKQKLFLVRDRIGEKPIYYYHSDNNFVFSSELKAMNENPLVIKKISDDASELFLRLGYIPEPYSIYESILKVNPGEIVEFSMKLNSVSSEMYWQTINEIRDPHRMSFSEATSITHELLKKSVAKQLISDVPIGAFLSGGIDSSLICAIMSEISSTKIKTFSIGFNEKSFDESKYAEQVAQKIGSDHNKLIIDEKQALELIPKIPTIFSEPFADSSQIPTYFVSQLASTKVKVCLSGDAGDELFGGYNRYILTKQVWRFLKFLPNELRSVLSNLIISFTNLSVASPKNYSVRTKHFLDKLNKGGYVINSKDIFELYYKMIAANNNELGINGLRTKAFVSQKYKEISLKTDNELLKMMILDILTYLPGDILCKVDRSSMSHSLESRVPFLDPELVKFAINLPIHYKVKGSRGKLILREILSSYIPKEIFERPKMGFGIPINDWIRGPLKEWALDTLHTNNSEFSNVLNIGYYQDKLNEHNSGEINFGPQLWNVLMFLSWQKENN